VPLTKRQQFRRVTLLCGEFARNLAYHRAGENSIKELKEPGDFWTTVHINFLNCCVLEWCKLFVDTKNRKPGEHHWESVVSDKVRFKAELLQYIGHIDETVKDFAYVIMVMSTYRNKFVAHLDEYNIAQIPPMDMPKDAVQFYHSYIVRNEANSGDLAGLPTDLDDYYSACYQEAEKIYAL
jgi:hypothetical protein